MSRGWTPRSVARRAAEVARAEGLGSLAFRVIGELGFRRMLLMERPFEPPLADVDPGLPVEFREATLDDADVLAALSPEADMAEVRRRFDAGHVCWVGVLEGRVVQCCWIGIGRARIDYLDAELVLPPLVGYLYELYTEPGLRGGRLHRAMYPHIFRAFAHRDPVAVCAAFHPENRIHRIFERLGFRPVATIGYVGIGGWRKLFYRPLSGADARPRGHRPPSRRAGTPSSPEASTDRSRVRASTPAPRGS